VVRRADRLLVAPPPPPVYMMKEKFGFEGVNRRSEVRERLERNVLEREKKFFLLPHSMK
jgi:hypothetical protein